MSKVDKFMQIADYGMKVKKKMLDQNLEKAVTNCPFCKTKKALHLRLSRTSHRGNRPFAMKCDTPKCIMMME